MSDADDSALQGVFGPRQVDDLDAAAVRATLRLRMFGRLDEPSAIGRFEVRRFIDAGAMGRVYAAFDPTTGQEVALKRLAHDDPELRLRLKREFRAAAEVVHPNLVELHELFVGEEVFFTMELVEGAPLTQVCAEGAGEVRAIASQLADGLAALHRGGHLHLDVKPSNVLVTDDGRVVLFDFGLSRARAADPLAPESDAVGGTPIYMAPEQMRGESVGEAADWYAFGAVLYELLCGRSAVSATRLPDLLRAKLGEIEPPWAVRSAADRPLSELALSLLDPVAAARPDGAEVLRALGTTESRGPMTTTSASTLVGREAELGVLEQAYAAMQRGEPALTFVLGEPGMGKTTLVRSFIDRVARADGPVVVAGRCHEHESVPYRGFDEVFDQLGTVLARASDAARWLPEPADALPLVTAFPSLLRVPWIAPAGSPAPAPVRDAGELRWQAFAAMRRLLARIAEDRGLIVVLDDWQWADRDAQELASHLCAGPDAPKMLLVIISRETADAGLMHGRRSFEVEVGPLPASAARQLLLHSAPPEMTEEDTLAILADAAGCPLFLRELVRGAPIGCAAQTLDGLVEELVTRLGPQARALIRTVALAGQPLPAAVAERASGMDARHRRSAVAHLRSARLLADGARGSRGWVPAHARIGNAVVAQCPRADRLRLHAELAAAYVEEIDDPAAAATHWHHAGEDAQAAECSIRAAIRARRVLAFDRAAQHYRNALKWGAHDPTRRRELLEELAGTFGDAGRAREAASAFLEAAALSVLPAKDVLRRRAAAELLRAGHIDEGRVLLARVLARYGLALPRFPVAAVVLERGRLLLPGARSAAHRSTWSPAELERIDACWAVATGLGLADLLTSAAYFARGTRLALAAREPIRVARWLSLRATQASLPGRPARRRTAAILEQASAAVRRVDDPLAEGLLCWARGAATHALGQWPSTVSDCDGAAAMFRAIGRSVWWELTGAQIMAESALYWLGDLRELGRRVECAVEDAEARGDLLAVVTRRAGGLSAVGRLAAGDPDRAEVELQHAVARWSRGGLHVQHWYAFQAAVQIALYRGDRRVLRRMIELEWPRLDRAWVHRAQTLRIAGRWRYACAELGASGDAPGRLRRARAQARRLRAEGLQWAGGLADLVDASVAAHQGDRAAAAKRLETGIERCDRTAMRLMADVGRLRLGAFLQGSDGDELVRRSARSLQDRGVIDPQAFARTVVPWPEG